MSNELTDQEQEHTARIMLNAALGAIGEFPDDGQDEDQNKIARDVLKAIRAAHHALASEYVRYESEKSGSCYIDAEVHEVVASAFFIRAERIDLPISEISPRCIGGRKYLAFAQGMIAAKMMTDALDLIDEGDQFAFASRGAGVLLKYAEDNKETP